MQNLLIISGFDATASAGILLDCHAAKTLKTQPFAVAPSLLIQNHGGISGNVRFSKHDIKSQLEAVPFQPQFVKIGLLQTLDAIELVGEFLAKQSLEKQLPIAVVDIPLVSSSGGILVEDFDEYIAQFKAKILPFTHIFTPNQFELEAFGGVDEIFSHGCKHILEKGGHIADANFATDTLHHPTHKVEFSLPRIGFRTSFHVDFSENIRGTGCALSTAIACFLLQGLNLDEAIAKAKKFVHDGILNSTKVNEKTRVLQF